MLAIRLKRTGRKGHAQYRVIVQDSHRHPSSGKVAAYIGSYDPHAKTASLDTEKAQFYLDNGAQPSNRVAVLLKSEGVKLPSWVKIDSTGAGTLRNPDKLRRNQPKEEAATTEAPAEEAPADEAPVEETKPEAAEAAPAEETPETEAKAEEAEAEKSE